MKNKLINDYLKYEKKIKNFKIIDVHSNMEFVKVHYRIDNHSDMTIEISLLDLINFTYEHTNKTFIVGE